VFCYKPCTPRTVRCCLLALRLALPPATFMRTYRCGSAARRRIPRYLPALRLTTFACLFLYYAPAALLPPCLRAWLHALPYIPLHTHTQLHTLPPCRALPHYHTVCVAILHATHTLRVLDNGRICWWLHICLLLHTTLCCFSPPSATAATHSAYGSTHLFVPYATLTHCAYTRCTLVQLRTGSGLLPYTWMVRYRHRFWWFVTLPFRIAVTFCCCRLVTHCLPVHALRCLARSYGYCQFRCLPAPRAVLTVPFILVLLRWFRSPLLLLITFPLPYCAPGLVPHITPARVWVLHSLRSYTRAPCRYARHTLRYNSAVQPLLLPAFTRPATFAHCPFTQGSAFSLYPSGFRKHIWFAFDALPHGCLPRPYLRAPCSSHTARCCLLLPHITYARSLHYHGAAG